MGRLSRAQGVATSLHGQEPTYQNTSSSPIPTATPPILQRAAQAQGEADTCVGPTCFRATFLALAVVGLLAAAAGVVLYRRSSALYRRQASRLSAH